MYQKTCIFHLILLGIPSSLVLSVKNKRWFATRRHLLNGRNWFSVTKAIWWSPKEKIAQTLFEIKHHKQSVFFDCFLIQQWSCHNNIVTERVSNLSNDSAAECVGRRVPFLPGGLSKMCTPGTIANSQTKGAN